MTASSVDIALFAAKIGLVFFVILTLAAYLVFAERKILAWVQDRKGPNRVGPFGLLQPLADLIKLLTKEDFLPAAADKWLFYLAPAMAAIPAIMIFAVIPFGAPLTVAGHNVPLVVADLNIGLLFFLALSSIAVYGVAIGGWASNSK
jgi:NADH-quinone oxidoreductase subunit H